MLISLRITNREFEKKLKKEKKTFGKIPNDLSYGQKILLAKLLCEDKKLKIKTATAKVKKKKTASYIKSMILKVKIS